MPLWGIFASVALVGVVLAAVALVALRSTGADPRTARRLAGPRQVRLGRLLDAERLPARPVRVAGRIRCREPLEAGADRLVAYHRDVEIRFPGAGWRSLERVRESRSFELWDHAGAATIDPAQAAEPLLTIPSVWRGTVDELDEPYRSSAGRLEERLGPSAEARATTRMLNVTDRLLVVARASRRDGGPLTLEPPEGGYLITNLPLDDAMRLLGGRRRRLMVASMAGVGLGTLLAVGGVLGALAGLLLGS